jgi:hypothetical protein
MGIKQLLFQRLWKSKPKIFQSNTFKYLGFMVSILSLGLNTILAQQANVVNPATEFVPFVNGSSPAFTVTQTNVAGGSNAARIIDSDLNNIANGNAGTVTYKVTDAANTYLMGNTVGFKFNSSAGTVKVRALNGATVVGEASQTFLVASGITELTVVATGAYNAIEVEYKRPLLALLGSIDVYYAFQRRYVAGAALICGNNKLAAPAYPLTVSATGTNTNPINAISASTTDFATITSQGANATLIIKDQVIDNPDGVFVGFDLENTKFATDQFGGLTITTYLNGSEQESISGSALQSLGLAGNRQIVGFTATGAFDEAKVTYNNGNLFGANTTNVYGLVIKTICGTPANVNLACNIPTTIDANPANVIQVSGTNTTLGKVTNPSNALTAGADFTLIDAGALSVVKYSVLDKFNKYIPNPTGLGIFVGFDMANSIGNILPLVGVNLTMRTYLDGTLVETKSAVADFFEEDNAAGRKNVGFRAMLPFDEIQIEYTSGVNLTNPKRLYGVVIEQVCPSPALTNCASGVSTPVTATAPSFQITAKTESTPLLGGTITNFGNVINANTTDFAEITSNGAGGIASIIVKDKSTVYPAGTFAGFDIENLDFVANPSQGLSFTTYLNGSKQEDTKTFSVLIITNSTNSLAYRSPPNMVGRQTVGILTSKPFDEVQLSYNHVDIPFFPSPKVKVYGVVLEKTCSIELTECNVPKSAGFPAFAVKEASFMAGGCLSAITGQGALTSPDPTDYVTFAGGLQVGCYRAVGISNPKPGETFPLNSFVGFETEVLALATVSLADVSIIETYLNGVKVETKTFVSVANTATLGGGKNTIGFKTTMPFDEFRFVKIGTASVDLGVTNVYRAIIQKTCPVELVCNKQTKLTTAVATVTHDSFKTPLISVIPINGFPQGFPVPLPAAGCNGFLNNVEALVTPDPNDFASMINIQALGCVQWVEIKDHGTIYPAGTYAGVDLQQSNLVSLAVGDLRCIETYLDNNLLPEETFCTGGIAAAGLLSAGRQTLGFVTTKPFNRIRYSQSIALAVAQGVTTQIYGMITMDPCAGEPLACIAPNANPGVDADFVKQNSPPPSNTSTSTNVGRAMTLGTNPNDAFLDISVCSNIVLNSDNAISSDPNDFASITLTGVNCAASFTFNNIADTFGPGHFAGVEIENSNFISGGLIGGSTIETYLNGVFQESANGAGLGSFDIGSTGRRKIGFVTTKPFNSIKYIQGQLLGVSLGVTKLYGSVVRKLCAGPDVVCNVETRLIWPTYAAGAVKGQSGGCASGVLDYQSLTTEDPDDYASFTAGLNILCDRYVGVSEALKIFPAGSYAGFDVQNIALVSLSAFSGYKIQTWLNGVKQEEKVVSSLLGGSALGSTRGTIGFFTTMPFNELRYVVSDGASAGGGETHVFAAIVKAPSCASPALVCDVPAVVASPAQDLTVSTTNGGIGATTITNRNNVITADQMDFAELTNVLGAGLYTSISVRDLAPPANSTPILNTQTGIGMQPIKAYPSGTFAGFRISNASIVDLNALGLVTITTYLNGVEQESRTGASLISGNILANPEKTVGFVVNKPFDEVKYTQFSTVGLSVGGTKVFNAVLTLECETPLICNIATDLNTDLFPVSVYQGQSGGCVSGVSGIDALTSPSATDFASFSGGLNILCDRYIGVVNNKTVYPAGTYAGFDVQFVSVAEVALNNYKIETYLNGVKKEEIDAKFAITYGLYSGTARFPIGFKTTQDFNEIRYVLKSGASVSLAGVNVFNAIVMKTTGCAPTLLCSDPATSYDLSPTGAKSFPVVVDGAKSGITGACLGCTVTGAENLLSASITDYAEITIAAGLANEGKIAILDVESSYPPGTKVGFSYKNVNNVFDASLFTATKVRTYLNGVLQEEKTASSLIQFPIITSWSTPQIQNIGFTATKEFDEAQIAFSYGTGSLNVLRVYGAFIDIKTANGGGLVCSDSDKDGVSDIIDQDDDNDGISDVIEDAACSPIPTLPALCDNDGDGIPNSKDLDSDNDGLPDVVEAGGLDPDHDGRVGTGSPTVDPLTGLLMMGGGLLASDKDGDGKANFVDRDSDADGIPDGLESLFLIPGGPDPDNDGIIGTGPIVDSDGDGLSDVVDPINNIDGSTTPVAAIFSANSGLYNQDRDGDGKPNYLDIDADNDGIVDNIEGQPTVGYIAPSGMDTDGDGIDNAYDVDGQGFGYVNTDGGSAPDYVDSDSDNDRNSIPNNYDLAENALDAGNVSGTGVYDPGEIDTQTYNAITGMYTAGPDGVMDANDPGYLDSDNDGLADIFDADGASATNSAGATNGQSPSSMPNKQPGSASAERDYREVPDRDGDGVVDASDLDDDNDGILDTVEGVGDFDGDGIPNNLDLDSDNDGISDLIESGNALAISADSNGDGKISPMESASGTDGIPLAAQGTEGGTPPNPTNTDGGPNPNFLDIDSDGDGINDVIEAGGSDPDNNGQVGTGLANDIDADGIPDAVDTVGPTPVGVALPITDTDGDGIPDYKEVDSDGDGISDALENSVCTPLAQECDTDGDGIPNYQDLDSDNDGISDAIENGMAGAPLKDSDMDGKPDAYDTDSDGDGITDLSESVTPAVLAMLDPDGDGIITGVDTDGDGVPNVIDSTPMIFGDMSLPLIDTDGDTIPDIIDLDSDNDGINDSVENSACTPLLASCDTDMDGIPNSKDLDSDGDNIKDVIEAGGADPDNNGVIGTGIPVVDSKGIPTGGSLTPPDTDMDTKQNPYDTDSDGDGLSDMVEGVPGYIIALDTDGDGTPDSTDLDDDGDGIADVQDKLPLDTDNDGLPNITDLDDDGDGILDTAEAPGKVLDTDNDGTPNQTDTDDDGDGILDTVEIGSALDANGKIILPDSDGDLIPDLIDPLDTDGDGIPDASDPDMDGDGIANNLDKLPLDTDNDGMPNMSDTDDDGDGILDTAEALGKILDTDNDGVPNESDTDDDNDGILDTVEIGSALDGMGKLILPDTDGDGKPDLIDALDTDGDGIFDSVDTDDDGDGILDIEDLLPIDTDNDGIPNATDIDDDGDSIPDTSEAPGKALDTDNDGTPNATDTDDDNDGILDTVEIGMVKDGNGKYILPDGDMDGKPDLIDLIDTDSDGIPDATDTDDDNDGLLDTVDALPLDTDNDGDPNATDPDDDADGILDTVEPTKSIDTDNDGLPNDIDLDDDGDGIADTVENGNTLDGNGKLILPDTDGDGIIDSLDTDSDGDGIADSKDKLPTDTDNDGLPNATDPDDDGDGIADASEGPGLGLDTDNDGMPNAIDTDDDGDGILDTIEIGTLEDANGKYILPDQDGDGKPDLIDILDTDNDGIPDGTDPDDDNDGIVDAQDKLPLDTDNDGVPNLTDLDDDGDGIIDTAEALGKALDTDNDGLPNATDPDDDNDGVSDTVELGPLVGGQYTLPDTDGNGIPDLIDKLDTDGDGITDALDLDDDGDGILDAEDKYPLDTDNDNNPNVTDLDDDGDGIADTAEAPGKVLDTDNDGQPNATDPDDDNDGIADIAEIGMLVGGKYELPDSDGDGLPDLVDINDTDGDGTIDGLDLDDDGDGIADSLDKFPLDTDNDGTPNNTDTDDDGDGVLDSAEAPGQVLDTDNDGMPNETDTDDDNDGIPDNTEIGMALDVNGKLILPDVDGDGKPDLIDSIDTDGDGMPDVTDPDDDGDGIADSLDKYPLDTDNDGTPNTTDTDDDGDGILDTAEMMGKALDTDNDGIPNETDTDDDNDGILDAIEIGMSFDIDGKLILPDVDGDGKPDLIDGLDTDNDGIFDSVDADDDNDGIPDAQDLLPIDTDNDGTPNATDPDDDGDGILDTAEMMGKSLDTDNDGIPNETDTDDDNDGILDTVEIGTMVDGNGKLILPDIDGDGKPDLIDALDTDGDGIPDITDTDDDGDGIADIQDKFPLDTDNDGIPNTTDPDDDGDGILDTAEAPGKVLDTDNDGIPNQTDTDDDGDGIPDNFENGAQVLDGNGKLILPDTDGDGVPDMIDIDSDNDGIPDIIEVAACNPPSNVCDTDNDGVPNYKDLDSDNDGINDVVEGGNGSADTNGDGILNSADTGVTIAPNGSPIGSGINPPTGVEITNPYNGPATTTGTDTDGDGILSSADGNPTGRGDAIDTDADGIPDATDPDDDNDGIPDTSDTLPLDTDNDGIPNETDPDDDGDSIPDISEVPGKELDTDNDGLLNGVDPDDDGDGIPDITDALPLDTDNDGIPNGTDPDDDGDGLVDTQDPKLGDTDNDGIKNDVDPDVDGDGILNTNPLENVGGVPTLDSDNDGILNETDTDDDGDGILDTVEQGTPTTPGGKFPLPDSDNDGTPDLADSAITALPDLNPTIDIDDLGFILSPLAERDFIVDLFELEKGPTTAPVVFRITKMTSFDITVPGLTLSTSDQSGTSGTSIVGGGRANENGNWLFKQNASTITITSKPGVVITKAGIASLGLHIKRKAGVSSGTSQNLTVTILTGTGGGDSELSNNLSITPMTAD